jgi:hypothetical protein
MTKQRPQPAQRTRQDQPVPTADEALADALADIAAYLRKMMHTKETDKHE